MKVAAEGRRGGKSCRIMGVASIPPPPWAVNITSEGEKLLHITIL